MKENIILILKLIFVWYFFFNGILGLAKICELILQDERVILLKHFGILNLVLTTSLIVLCLFIFCIEHFKL